MIAAAFYPKPVIVRLSDFKTNEYARLLGGEGFEPKEENPMLGFRGAARYAHPAYAAGFALECAALRRVRADMGLTNVRVMVPFCRRVDEARRVLETMADHGLKRGENGLEVYVMCEIPNNVISIDAFAKLFDGFSIGSNDLTQLTLGVDRDSEIVSFDFDERDPGMLEMLRLAVARRQTQRPSCRYLRRGPGELSRDRALSCATRDRLDQRESVKHATHDAGSGRGRNGRRGATSRARYRAVIRAANGASNTQTNSRSTSCRCAACGTRTTCCSRRERRFRAHAHCGALSTPHAASAENSCNASASALTAVIVCVSSW